MNSPKLNGVDAELLMRDLYESSYKIYDHLSSPKDKKANPFASVSLHESEDTTNSSLLFNAFRTFSQKGIKETFGLTLKEFLDLPTEYCIELTEIATKEAVKKTGMINEIEKSINRQ